MIKPLNIEFDFVFDGISAPIRLKAIAKFRQTEGYFIVSNIQTNSDFQVLPDLDIKKVKDRWVHIDSEKKSHLCESAGNAIDFALSAQFDEA